MRHLIWNFTSGTFEFAINCLTNVFTGLSQHDDEHQKAVKLKSREKRFIKFASVEYNGQLYMTPQDFLNSVVQVEASPTQKRRALTKKELELLKDDIPSLKKGNGHMFRNLRDKGIISYTEYLFLLSILTKPKTGFRIAFNMFDTDGNERLDKTEFLVIQRLLNCNMRMRKLDDETKRAIEKIFSHAWRCRHDMDTKESLLQFSKRQNTLEEIREQYVDDNKGLQRKHAVDTTLMIHFFGKNGTDDLKYEDFKLFMENLQNEVLEVEFLQFSKGSNSISEMDFAKFLLRYTYLNTYEYDRYLNRIKGCEHSGTAILFDEFQHFYQFLNNLDDFTIAMRMYTLADQPISKDEFQRAVKVCTGHALSNHIIDTIFALFDDDGDGELSYEEFIAIMKDRMNRKFKYSLSSGEKVFQLSNTASSKG